IRRQLVIRFEPTPGFHLYGEPVPEGMVATRVDIKGPPGLVVEDPILPPTKSLELKSLDVQLQVYSGVFDIIVPFYADGRLASEVRPLDMQSAEVEITVRYQACDDHTCLLPKTETLTLDLPLDVIDVPALGLHMGHGQREGNFKAAPHLRRMIFRVLRRNPLDLLRYLAKNIRLTLAAHRRQG
ncbi:MAG: protein-disulfide reductase DsbD domain-containing protein, partial [Myxococcota bacterium]